MELVQITPRCYALPFSRTADRPTLGYVRGDRLALRIDAGNSPAHARLMDDACAAAGLPAADFIALTHSHWDHTYGAAGTACPVIACAATQRHLSAMARWAWTPEAMQTRLDRREDIRFCHDAILEEYPDPAAIRVRTADLTFDRTLTLDLGGVHAVLTHVVNSHADDCVIIHIPEEHIVFLGDICYEDLHHEPPCIHRLRFEALRETLAALDFDRAVMGHQGVLTRAELDADMQETLADPETILLDD